MKRCPTCNRTYDGGKFCLEDATPLVGDEQLAEDIPPVPVSPNSIHSMSEGSDKASLPQGVGPQTTRPSDDFQRVPPTVFMRASERADVSGAEASGYDDEMTAIAMPKEAAQSDWTGPTDWAIPIPAAASAPAASTQRSKLRLLLIIAPIALILILIGGFLLWWQSFKTTPAYTLALLVDAVHNNDQATVDEIVDTNKIVESFIPQVTEKALGQYASGLTSALQKQVEEAVPTLKPRIKEMVREEVTGQVKEMAARAEGKPFILIALGMSSEVDIEEKGDAAEATVKLKDRTVVLVMQRNDDRWKIVGVKDDSMALRIVQKLAKDLPSMDIDKDKLEKEIRKRAKDLPGGLPNIPGVTDGDRNKKNK